MEKKTVSKVCEYLRRLSSFSEIMQIPNVLQIRSFVRDHSKLDISRKHDGYAYSEMEIL